MAKKQKTEKVVEPLIEKDFEEVETPVMEIPEPKTRERIKPKNEWEINPSLFNINCAYFINMKLLAPCVTKHLSDKK